MPVVSFEDAVKAAVTKAAANLKLSADEKKLFENAIANDTELKGGFLRHDDYSRKTQELSEQKAKYEEAVEYKEKMEPWAGKVYSSLETAAEKGWFDLEKGEEHFSDKYTELEKQLEAAKLGGDMDPKEVEKLIQAKVQEIAKQAGGLTREEAAALYQAESKKLVEDGFKAREEKFNSETIPFIAGFAGANAVVAMRYEKESGEKWTTEKQQEFYKMMSAEGKFDPYALEDKLLAPVKEKKAREQEIEKKAQERADAILKERGISSGMPGGGGERIIPQFQQPAVENPIGLLQKAMAESADKAPVDVRDSVLAGVVEGAKELVEAGKY